MARSRASLYVATLLSLASRAVTMRVSSRAKKNKVTKRRQESYFLAQDAVKYYSG